MYGFFLVSVEGSAIMYTFFPGTSPPDREYQPGDVTLPGRLRFTTGTSTILPMGLHVPIRANISACFGDCGTSKVPGQLLHSDVASYS